VGKEETVWGCTGIWLGACVIVWLCVHVCVCVCVCVCMCVCMCACAIVSCAIVCACVHTRVHSRVRARAYACMCAPACSMRVRMCPCVQASLSLSSPIHTSPCKPPFCLVMRHWGTGELLMGFHDDGRCQGCGREHHISGCHITGRHLCLRLCPLVPLFPGAHLPLA
jgi:hypothetical protein